MLLHSSPYKGNNTPSVSSIIIHFNHNIDFPTLFYPFINLSDGHIDIDKAEITSREQYTALLKLHLSV